MTTNVLNIDWNSIGPVVLIVLAILGMIWHSATTVDHSGEKKGKK